MADQKTTFMKTHALTELLNDCKKKVFTLAHDVTVKEALKELSDRRILSAPCVLSPTEKQKAREGRIVGYCGIVHVRSVLESLMKRLDAKQKEDLKKKKQGGEQRSHLTTGQIAEVEEKLMAIVDRWEELNALGEQFGEEKVLALTDLSDVCEGVTFAQYKWNLGRFIDSIMENMEGNHVHRVVLFDRDGNIENYITQSDIVRFLYNHMDEFKDVSAKNIENLGLYDPKKPVVTVTAKSNTATAFQTMFKENIGCVAVVDECGALVGNLSSSDLRGMSTNEFALLDTPVGVFLKIGNPKWRKQSEVVLNAALIKARTLTIKKTANLQWLLSLVAESRAHSCYIVDQNLRPIGIITLTDILRVMRKILA